jgi:hypothetical protein
MSSISKTKSMLVLAGTIVGFLNGSPDKIVNADESFRESADLIASKSTLIAQNSIGAAQPLDGLWIGTFTQNHHPKLWNVRMRLAQNEQSVEGTSAHEPIMNEQISVIYELKGIFTNNTLTFYEGKMLDRVGSSKWLFCNINGKMDLSYARELKLLNGYWECFTPGERHFGKISLKKQ